MEKGAMCQSCGMPLEKDEHCGTNTDGSKNEEYCTYCFQEGAFTQPDVTLDDMINKIAEVTGQKMTPAETEKSKTFLSTLKRWKI